MLTHGGSVPALSRDRQPMRQLGAIAVVLTSPKLTHGLN
jgi:hypothetical protein